MLRIGYIVGQSFQVMIFGGLTVFELANRMTKEPHYDIRLISEGGGAPALRGEADRGPQALE
jgi:hypothetical protein